MLYEVITLLALVLALIFSEINIKTSLYKAADNSVEISYNFV